MSESMEIWVPDEPALIVTTGRGEAFTFTDGGPRPEVTGLGAAVLVTRLRWWADEIERRAARDEIERQFGLTSAATEERP